MQGTINYYSPERFVLNKDADSGTAMAADVWGLGLTLLELFLGRSAINPKAQVPKPKDWEHTICDQDPPSVLKDVDASMELCEFIDAACRKIQCGVPRCHSC